MTGNLSKNLFLEMMSILKQEWNYCCNLKIYNWHEIPWCGDMKWWLQENDINTCFCFSLQCDESRDIREIVQLLLFIRTVFKDYTSKEERTRGAGKLKAFNLRVTFSISSIITDGVRAKMGHTNGFITSSKYWRNPRLFELPLHNSPNVSQQKIK